VHGDIQPNNIFFRSETEDTVKLIDFGTSRRIADDHHMHAVYGTAYFCAPEVIDGDYSEKCDVWSIGVLLYMLLSGQPPFNGAIGKDVTAAIKKGQYAMSGDYWDKISAPAKDLIK
jgi:calcium-dependent protein kinase